MDEAQESLNQDNAEEVQEHAGVDSPSDDSTNESEAGSLAKDGDPHAVKKRLGMQAKRHQKDIRALQDQIRHMQSQMGNNPAGQSPSESSSYANPPNTQGMSIEEQIHRGVDYALRVREEQERKAKDNERMQHVHRQYQRLNDEFDKGSEKYEDFDDVVRGDDAPFTPHVRDALLLIDNPSDVAYKLGKNREELSRIAQLHPLDQAREVNKLSFALMGGNRASSAPSGSKTPLSPIKANPVNSSASNSAASIRAKMKAGTWK